MKKHVLQLTDEERLKLEQLVKKGNVAGWKIRRSQVLLACDQNSGLPDEAISRAYSCSVRSIENWRKAAVQLGALSCLARKEPERPRRARILTGEDEARLVCLACSEAPDGRAQWTLRLLADRLVELEIVDAVSYETVRRTLKKTNLSLGKR